MIIFAVSSDFGLFGLGFSTGNEVNPIVLEYDNDVPRQKIVDDIHTTWAKNPGNIDCLFLCAHGNSGVLALGSPGIGKVGAALFAKLKGTFAAGSRGVEIHGCACASSTDISRWDGKGTASAEGKGFDFLSAMAANCGVRVTAPIDSVWGFNAAYSYEDVRTMTVWPDKTHRFTDPDDYR